MSVIKIRYQVKKTARLRAAGAVPGGSRYYRRVMAVKLLKNFFFFR